nr:MAG TPA: hypothetical protein [Caudoviricetes sp.]
MDNFCFIIYPFWLIVNCFFDFFVSFLDTFLKIRYNHL